MAGTTLGFGSPIAGLSPYSGVNINPFMASSVTGQSMFQPTPSNPYSTAAPLQQQIQQLLQIVPQQLQQLSQLAYVQQQQAQQLLQVIPAQLAQLQHVIQLTQHAQQQPFGIGISTLPLWSASPQLVGGQPGYVM